MINTRSISIAAFLVTILSAVASASLVSTFLSPSVPAFFRDDLMGFDHGMLAPRQVLRTMHEMEKLADGLMSDALEDNCNSGKCKTNATDVEEKGLSSLRSLHMRPRFDLRETPEGVLLTAFTPGLRKDQLQVEVVEHNNVPTLVIAGESNSTLAGGEGEGESTLAGTVLPYKASYKRFERRIRIPHNVDRSTIKADYNDGMLTVTMSRAAVPTPQKKTILIQ
mmetsp:Transcript_3729/g.7742  ORF Transcript_3729/g.7742 Transcript_3729/m.7742 type:complete len:223 (+) Transcript_3729:3-671(+)